MDQIFPGIDGFHSLEAEILNARPVWGFYLLFSGGETRVSAVIGGRDGEAEVVSLLLAVKKILSGGE